MSETRISSTPSSNVVSGSFDNSQKPSNAQTPEPKQNLVQQGSNSKVGEERATANYAKAQIGKLLDKQSVSPGAVYANRGLRANGAPAPKVAMNEFEAAFSRVDAASKLVQQDKTQLAADIAKFGGALTPKQLADYRKQFNNSQSPCEHQQQLDEALHQAMDVMADKGSWSALKKHVEHNSEDGLKFLSDLQQIAGQLGGSDEKTLQDAHILLDRAGELVKDGGFPFGNKALIARTVMTPAAAVALAPELNNAKTAAEFTHKLTDFLKPYGSLLDVSMGGRDLPKAMHEFKEALEVLDKGGHAASTELEKIADKWKSRGPLGQMMIMFSVGYKALKTADGLTKEDATNVEKFQLTGDALKAGSELFSVALTKAESKIAVAGAEKAATALAKLVPFAGVLVSTATLASDSSDFSKRPDAGMALALVGDVVSLTGSLVECAAVVPGVGDAVAGAAGVVNSAGLMLSGAGTYLSGVIRSHEDNRADIERQKALLTPVLKDVNLSKVFAEAGDGQVRWLRNLGISDKEVQKLAYRQPDLIKTGGLGSRGRFDQMMNAFDLKGSRAYNFLTAVGKDDPMHGTQLDSFLNLFNSANSKTLTEFGISKTDKDPQTWTKQEWLGAIDRLSHLNMDTFAFTRKAVENMNKFLNQH